MSSESFILRRGTPDDALAIIDAHRDAVRGTAAEYYSRDIIEEWGPTVVAPERVSGFQRAIAGGQEVVVLAVDAAGTILGFGSIIPSRDELRAVYVRSNNGRQGIGRVILQRLEELARKSGLKELSMDASINAESFYKANGYLSVGAGEHTMSSGARMACVRMRKRL